MMAIGGVVVNRPLHPIHAILLAGALPLFLGVLLSDMAYAASYEVQWKNFASWLLVGALVFAGLALLWAIVDFIRLSSRDMPAAIYPVLLMSAWILGFINAFVHARDAWASMPTGLVLSAIVALLVVAAAGFGFATRVAGAVR